MLELLGIIDGSRYGTGWTPLMLRVTSFPLTLGSQSRVDGDKYEEKEGTGGRILKLLLALFLSSVDARHGTAAWSLGTFHLFPGWPDPLLSLLSTRLILPLFLLPSSNSSTSGERDLRSIVSLRSEVEMEWGTCMSLSCLPTPDCRFQIYQPQINIVPRLVLHNAQPFSSAIVPSFHFILRDWLTSTSATVPVKTTFKVLAISRSRNLFESLRA